MEQTIGRKFTFWGLIRFVIPTICTMLCYSLYTVIDGIFVSRFVGDDALAAVNIVYPLINLVLGVGVMFATGGSAVVAKTMGEGKLELARSRFTMLTATAFGIGVVLLVISRLLLMPLIHLLGSTPILDKYCYEYISVMMLFSPFIILKIIFDYFFVTAGKPKFALFNSIAGGIANIMLDYVFIVVLGWGIAGAAWATVMGFAVPAISGVGYFLWSNNQLRFSKFRTELNMIIQTCSNGSSEMISQLSMGITTYLFNILMLHYAGEGGITAITIVLYAEFLFVAIMLGFSSGIAPIVSYRYGAKDRAGLQHLIRFAFKMIIGLSIIAFCVAQAAAELVVQIFTSSPAVMTMATAGFRLFAFSFLFSGICTLSSGLFTALSNGRISAIISFMRNCGILVACMLLLPIMLGLDGVWLAVPAADIIAGMIAGYYLYSYQVFYGYCK